MGLFEGYTGLTQWQALAGPLLASCLRMGVQQWLAKLYGDRQDLHLHEPSFIRGLRERLMGFPPMRSYGLQGKAVLTKASTMGWVTTIMASCQPGFPASYATIAKI